MKALLIREASAVQGQSDCRTAKQSMRYTYSPLDSIVLHCMLPLHQHHSCKVPASGYILSRACLVTLLASKE